MCHFFSDVLLFANNVSLGPVKRCLAEPQVWASCMNAYTHFAKQHISFVFDWFLQNIIFNRKFTGPIKIMVLYIQLGQYDDTVSVSWWHCDMETPFALLVLGAKGQWCGKRFMSAEDSPLAPMIRCINVFFHISGTSCWINCGVACVLRHMTLMWRHCNVVSPWWNKTYQFTTKVARTMTPNIRRRDIILLKGNANINTKGHFTKMD